MKSSPQLHLFADQFVTWETLTAPCQQAVREYLSQLFEQAVGQLDRETTSTTEDDHQKPKRKENHVG